MTLLHAQRILRQYADILMVLMPLALIWLAFQGTMSVWWVVSMVSAVIYWLSRWGQR